METMQTTVEHPTFETVWAALQKTERLMEKNAQEAAEWRKEHEKWREEADKQWKEDKEDFNRRLGRLTNLFGEITEAEMAPQLCDKFRKFGFDFPRANPNVFVNDRDNQIFLEIDIMLENGDKAMVVEVKTKLTTERIGKHIERMGKMRRYADIRGDKRTFLGAVAGIIVTDEVRKYALDQGFYLIEPSGESFDITPPNGGAKEW